ncbi:hypothetical protein [Flavobacterium poyangense]|uniref:hypothetical protein n=1 Tax=Flavobacterium poyangense TaxID=2204302 RepID=UPI0014216D08|nr:hypothetical protein [Flavobacterium sp. JXAS1]
MKNIVFMILILGPGLKMNAQMTVGKHTVKSSEITDFGNGGVSGIVLPWAASIPKENVLIPGMQIYPAIQKKGVYYYGTVRTDSSVPTEMVNLPKQTVHEGPEKTKETVIEALNSSIKGVLKKLLTKL